MQRSWARFPPQRPPGCAEPDVRRITVGQICQDGMKAYMSAMTGKTPEEAIREAMDRLPSARVFHSVKDATTFVKTAGQSFLLHKARMGQLSAEERDAADPIEAGPVLPSDMGTRARKQRVPFIDKILKVVTEATFCEMVPMNGTVSAWIVGRQSDRQVALDLISALVPTAERLADDEYIKNYHIARKAGDVKSNRGYKAEWYDGFVANVEKQLADAQQAAIAAEPSLADTLVMSRNDVVTYMNENFNQTRGNMTRPRSRK